MGLGVASSVEGLASDSGVDLTLKGVVIGGAGDELRGWRGGDPKCVIGCENGGPDCGKDWSPCGND